MLIQFTGRCTTQRYCGPHALATTFSALFFLFKPIISYSCNTTIVCHPFLHYPKSLDYYSYYYCCCYYNSEDGTLGVVIFFNCNIVVYFCIPPLFFSSYSQSQQQQQQGSSGLVGLFGSLVNALPGFSNSNSSNNNTSSSLNRYILFCFFFSLPLSFSSPLCTCFPPSSCLPPLLHPPFFSLFPRLSRCVLLFFLQWAY